MPYVSDKQRRFMHSQHPEIAARWDKEGKGYVKKKKKKKRKVGHLEFVAMSDIKKIHKS